MWMFKNEMVNNEENERIAVFHFVSKALIVDYCQSLACNYQKLWFFRLSFEYF